MTIRTHTSFKCLECAFEYVATHTKKAGGWLLCITEEQHNHEPSNSLSVHTIHCLEQLNNRCMNELQHEIHTEFAPHQILTQMCMDDSNLLFTSQDIYNIKTKVCCEQLGVRTLIQALIN